MTREPLSEWLAVATECDCGGIAVTLMHHSCLDADSYAPAGANEAAAHGDGEWQPLVIHVAEEMADRNRMRIFARCTVVRGPRYSDGAALENEVAEVLYRLEESRTS
jgi:hypothetical protein